MIDQQHAIIEAVQLSIESLHKTMLLGGYEQAEKIHQDFINLKSSGFLKKVSGQDWMSVSDEDHNLLLEEFRERQTNLWKTGIPDMVLVSAEPYFDGQQRREWAAVYSVRYDQTFLTFSASMGPWAQPRVFYWGWRGIDQPREVEKSLTLSAEQRDHLAMKVNGAIYAAIEQFHTQNSSNGYATQKAAYQRFIQHVPNGGYLAEGVERFQVASTEKALGEVIDPDKLEALFRDSWAIPLAKVPVLTAEYFPGLDGTDCWFVAYQVMIPGLTFNVFVKYYPHRRPQVEIVTDSSGL